jgi:beta-galactosidase
MSERTRIINANSNVYFSVILLAIVSLGLPGPAWAAQDASAHPAWPGPGQLFVGACYQPIDRSPEQIDQDITIMKRAGFNVVRMGDLSWDSFEPSQGKFTFE